MCVGISNNNSNGKISYSIKKALKTIFKKNKPEEDNIDNVICTKLSLESLENIRNAEVEIESDNKANERIYASSSCGSSIVYEDHYTETAIYVPVHFTRTEHGTFFWTTTSSIPAEAGQIAAQQSHDRWAHA